MGVHVAILLPRYVKLLLSGRKTIESRLTRRPVPPFGAVEPGQRIYFKVSAGPIAATAVAQKVAFYDRLTPQRVQKLRERCNDRICGEPAYWRAKRSSQYGTLIGLRDIEPAVVGPALPPSQGVAWFVLDDDADPQFSVTLTAGAIRNRYVRLGRMLPRLRAQKVELLLPDGQRVTTDIVKGSMLRWRGWGRYYDDHQMHSGDAVRFVPVGARRYRVLFIKR